METPRCRGFRGRQSRRCGRGGGRGWRDRPREAQLGEEQGREVVGADGANGTVQRLTRINRKTGSPANQNTQVCRERPLRLYLGVAAGGPPAAGSAAGSGGASIAARIASRIGFGTFS